MSGPKSSDFDYIDYEAIAREARMKRIREIEEDENAAFNNYRNSLKRFDEIRSSVYSSEIPAKPAVEAIKERIMRFEGSGSFCEDVSNSDAVTAVDRAAEFNDALEEYFAANMLVGREIPDCYEYTHERADELIQFFKSESRKIINSMTSEYASEKAYKTAKETLLEMGYRSVGENQSCGKDGNAPTVKSALFRVSGSVGVNLICIDGHKYTFEVVGLSEDQHGITEAEKQNILQAMKNMCETDFKNFIGRMEQKGLRAKGLTDRLPDLRFCRNICTADYVSSGSNEQEYTEERIKEQEG